MLERLVIRNFQCHTKKVIDLDPKVVCIVGHSDKGKSAILRALRWLVTGKPSGSSFVKRGAEACSVKLKVDGQWIKRERVGGDVSCWLGDQKFQAMHRDIPEPVADLLNVGEDTFQGQHDPSFWLSLTAGQAAKELNRVVDLSLIDHALTKIAAKVKHGKWRVDECKERLRDAEAKRLNLEWVPEAKTAFDQLERTYNEVLRNREKRDSLALLLRGVRESKERAQDAADAACATGKVLSLAKQRADLDLRASRLRELLDECTENDKRRSALSDETAEAGRALAKLKAGGCPVCGGKFNGLEQNKTAKK